MKREPAATRLALWLIGTAARRWPAELHTEMSAVWAAEIRALDREPGVGSVARAWRKLRFAISLAVARPVEPVGEPPRGWREHLAGANRIAGGVLVLLLVPVAAMFVAQVGLTAMAIAGTLAPAPVDRVVLNLSGIFGVVGAGLAGLGLARRTPLLPAGRWRHRAVAGALLAAVLLLIALLGVNKLLLLATGDTEPRPWLMQAVGTAVALAPMALLCLPAVRRLAGPRRRRTLAVAVLGAFLAADLGVAIAGVPAAVQRGFPLTSLPLWLPMDLFGNSWAAVVAADDFGAGAFSPALPFTVLLILPKVLMLTATFGIAYVVGLQTPTGEHLGGSADGAQATGRSGARAGVIVAVCGVAATLVGVLVWAVTATHLIAVPPAAVDDSAFFLDYPADLRYAAIILATLGVAATAAHLGALLAPTIVFAAGLIGVDLFLDAGTRQGPRYGVAAAVLGAVLAALVLRLSPTLAVAAPAEPRWRRSAAGIAVVAAFSAPAVPGHGEAGFQDPGPPTGIWLAALLVSTLLVLLAGCCATAARPAPPRGTALAWLTATIVVVALGTAVASTSGFGFLLAPVLGVAALAVSRFPDDRRRAAVFWSGMAVLAAAVAAPLWFLVDRLGESLGTLLQLLSPAPEPLGGTSVVLGAPLAGLIFAALFGRRRRPGPVPGTAPVPTAAQPPVS